MNEYTQADRDTFAMSRAIGISVTQEKGLQAVLRQTFEEASTKAKGSKDIRDAMGTDHISTYKELDAAVTHSYGVVENYDKNIGRKTYGDPRYNSSKAANKAAGNDNR
jgi:hypothetical protein